MWPFVASMALAVGGLLFAEKRGSRLGIWIAKPIASTVFVAAALSRGALGHRYGLAILAALALSWLGDLLLIPRSRSWFRAGLGSFLLAHLAYAGAFLVRGVALRGVLPAGALLIAAAWFVGGWLLPHVRPAMRGPVVAYMTAITAMVTLSVGGMAATGRMLPAVAAFGFYLSDLSVARDQFVAPGFDNRAWGLPLYYGAQLLFVATI
jgi:uncharacterized membrane protein YhhN